MVLDLGILLARERDKPFQSVYLENSDLTIFGVLEVWNVLEHRLLDIIDVVVTEEAYHPTSA